MTSLRLVKARRSFNQHRVPQIKNLMVSPLRGLVRAPGALLTWALVVDSAGVREERRRQIRSLNSDAESVQRSKAQLLADEREDDRRVSTSRSVRLFCVFGSVVGLWFWWPMVLRSLASVDGRVLVLVAVAVWVQLVRLGWSTDTEPSAPRGRLAVTEANIVEAFRQLHKPAGLVRAFKENGVSAVRLVRPVATVDGIGFEAVVDLARTMFADIKPHQAELTRLFGYPDGCLLIEPFTGAGAGHDGLVRLLFTEVPVSDRPAVQFVHGSGPVDVWSPVEVGLDDLNRPVQVCLMDEPTWLVAGLSGSGKSFSVRSLLLTAANDQSVDVVCLSAANKGDFDPLRGRALVSAGTSDQAVAEALEVFREVDRRIEYLINETARRQLPLGKMERKFVDVDYRPIVMVVDECHEYFGHPVYGAQFVEIAVRNAKRQRAAGVVTIYTTQNPMSAAIPTRLRVEITVRVAFRLAERLAVDAVLGEGSHGQGVTTAGFSKGDRGTAILLGLERVSGSAGETVGGPVTVRFPYIDGPTAARLAAQSHQARSSLGWLDSGQTVDRRTVTRSDPQTVTQVFDETDPRTDPRTVTRSDPRTDPHQSFIDDLYKVWPFQDNQPVEKVSYAWLAVRLGLVLSGQWSGVDKNQVSTLGRQAGLTPVKNCPHEDLTHYSYTGFSFEEVDRGRSKPRSVAS